MPLCGQIFGGNLKIIHIGMPKTATTSLQNAVLQDLFAGRAAWRYHNVDAPDRELAYLAKLHHLSGLNANQLNRVQDILEGGNHFISQEGLVVLIQPVGKVLLNAILNYLAQTQLY